MATEPQELYDKCGGAEVFMGQRSSCCQISKLKIKHCDCIVLAQVIISALPPVSKHLNYHFAFTNECTCKAADAAVIHVLGIMAVII